MLKDAIFVRSVYLKTALGEHANEGYTGLDDVHRLLGAHLDDTLVASSLTVDGYIEVEVDEYFELATILETESLE